MLGNDSWDPDKQGMPYPGARSMPGIDMEDPPITDHRYDCGPDELTGGPCIASVEIGGAGTTGEYQDCGEPRDRHRHTEYDYPLAEPGYYQRGKEDGLHFDDDSHDHLHPYVD